MLTIPEEVKDLCKSDSVKKNFRISFPNGERDDIINDNIVSESVSFTESICSQNKLKFGLQESSTLSFKTVGIENIKGYVLEAELEIDASTLGEVGTFDEINLDADTTTASMDLTTGQSFKLTSDNSAGCYYVISSTDSNGVISNVAGYWYNITSYTADLDDIAALIGADDSVSATVSITLLGYASGATMNMYLLQDISGDIIESDDLDYPYYPIKYGTFYVDTCKRSGELEQRAVECYSYPTIGLTNLFKKTMAYSWPESTYTVSQPGLFMISYLNPASVPDEYIVSTSDIEYTSASRTRSMSDILKTKELLSAQSYMRFTISTEYTQVYDVSSIADNTNHILHYKISKTANFDTILENAINEVLEAYEYFGLEDAVYWGTTGLWVKRYRSDEDMIRSAILEYSYPLAYFASNVNYSYRYIGTIEPEEGVYYCQNNTFTVATSYSATANPLARIYDGCSTEITVSYGGVTKTIDLDGPLYEVSILEDVEVDSSVVSAYDDWDITLSSEDYASKRVIYYISSSAGAGDTFCNFYSFNDTDAWDKRINELFEVNASFGCYERGSNSIKALTDDVAENIDPSLYTSLWYDDESVQSIDGAYYTYDNDGTAETTSYGLDLFYDLTSNTIIQEMTSTDDVQNYLEEYFFPNAIYSSYMPFTMTCIGLPYIEAGDYIKIQDKEENEIYTYVLRQTISGIQHLKSSMEAQSIDL